MLKKIYEKMFIHRYDDNGYIKYFSAEDFDGLKSEHFVFMSKNNKLKGNFYFYDGFKKDELIIFCHGIGGGHRSYMREIELLCKNGYKVLAYDNTGCFESEGKSISAMSQSLCDLDNAIKTLKNSGIFTQYKKVSVIGHSWGGYAAGNIGNYHDDITNIVVISGFVSVEKLLHGFFEKTKVPFKNFIVKQLMRIEKNENPNHYSSSSLDAINNTKIKYLISHSKDDYMVSFKNHAQFLQKNLKRNDIEFLICENKLHNPNYKLDALTYMNSVFASLKKETKAKKLKTVEAKKEFLKDTDWYRMTEQDEEFWAKVFEFLSK